jgi:Mg/Co/Ni transporter MgtE
VAVRRSDRDRPGAPRQAQDRLSRARAAAPADIADIVEDLPPAERESVFETIDEEVAAETLEELDPDVKVAIVESLDKDRAADIVEEMDPDAAADLLGDLPEEQSGEILKEMQPEERQEVTQLLEFGEHTACRAHDHRVHRGPETATVNDAIDALKRFEGSREALATIYLTGAGAKLTGAVTLGAHRDVVAVDAAHGNQRARTSPAPPIRRRTMSRRCSTNTT